LRGVDLYILRHGEAGQRMSVASRDADRSLTVSGKKEVEDISRALNELNLELDHILTSPLNRARETAKIISKILKLDDKLEESQELKPEGARPDLYRRLEKLKQDSSVLLVGHEPYLSTMISEITSGNSSARIILKKGGLARVHINAFNPKVSGELRWLLSPKLLKRLE
jgi:phosphohistidine phosphatase